VPILPPPASCKRRMQASTIFPLYVDAACTSKAVRSFCWCRLEVRCISASLEFKLAPSLHDTTIPRSPGCSRKRYGSVVSSKLDFSWRCVAFSNHVLAILARSGRWKQYLPHCPGDGELHWSFVKACYRPEVPSKAATLRAKRSVSVTLSEL